MNDFPNPIPAEEEPLGPAQPGEEAASEEFSSPAADQALTTRLEADGYTPLNVPTRRRRSRLPLIARPGAEEIANRLEALLRRAAPTFDYFVFSIAAGAILATGFLLDAPAILFFGVIAAPLLAPWLGVALALASGEARSLGQTLGGFITSILLILLISMLAGFIARLLPQGVYHQASLYAGFSWPSLLLLVLGSFLLPLAFHQSQEKPLLPGLLLSYALYLPLSAAGFGLSSGQSELFPQAALVFTAHLSISLLLLVSVFYYLGYRPLEMRGYAWGAGAILLSLILAGGILSLGNFPASISSPDTPSASPSPQANFSPTPNLLVLLTPASATATPGLVFTPSAPTRVIASPTPTPSPSAVPTPAYGKIYSPGGDGAIIRQSPSGPAITTIQNGYVVELLPDKPVRAENGIDWIHVRVKTSSQVIEGWVQVNLIQIPQP